MNESVSGLFLRSCRILPERAVMTGYASVCDIEGACAAGLATAYRDSGLPQAGRRQFAAGRDRLGAVRRMFERTAGKRDPHENGLQNDTGQPTKARAARCSAQGIFVVKLAMRHVSPVSNRLSKSVCVWSLALRRKPASDSKVTLPFPAPGRDPLTKRRRHCVGLLYRRCAELIG